MESASNKDELHQLAIDAQAEGVHIASAILAIEPNARLKALRRAEELVALATPLKAESAGLTDPPDQTMFHSPGDDH